MDIILSGIYNTKYFVLYIPVSIVLFIWSRCPLREVPLYSTVTPHIRADDSFNIYFFYLQVDEIEELNEDDPFALRFSENLIIPDSLPRLTTDNYNDFINEHSGCLLAFYLPC